MTDSGDDEDKLRAMVKRAAAARKGDEAETEKEPPPSSGDAPPSSEEGDVVVDEVDLKEALRGALRPPPGSVAPDLLRGVQKKLRVRSRGKFYGDGWSTSASPRSTYLVTSAIMLVLVAIVFLVLMPWASDAIKP
ncbi:MAG: hypothetical protein HOV80_12090 [Polyangiaceae bacterium]|nr:hypothetical protein [Polyangiaceae bacterium]